MKILNGNALKLIAAASMLIDHIGYLLLPEVLVLRIIGRIAFPIFAYMIAEGCKYTRHKLRYFLTVFTIGILCQIVNWALRLDPFLCVLLTFSVSILLIYALQWLKSLLASAGSTPLQKLLAFVFVLFVYTGAFLLTLVLPFDYGFGGIMVAPFASLFAWRGGDTPPEAMKRLDNPTVHALMIIPALAIICADIGQPKQLFSFISVFLLLFYSGKRGRVNLKYFFYIFYPLHLAVLGLINFLT